jgi:hypothetical protein
MLGENTMKSITRAVLACFVIAGVIMTDSPLQGDEGMWLFNNPPRDYLKKKYGFDADAKWLTHVQKSSVRFNSGGSGSFVSPITMSAQTTFKRLAPTK